MKSQYSLGSSHTGTSSMSDALHSRLLGANIKLDSDGHCFFVRERVLEEGFEKSTLFAQKYPTRIRLVDEDLKRLRMVVYYYIHYLMNRNIQNYHYEIAI
jgi:hypothetical protein